MTHPTEAAKAAEEIINKLYPFGFIGDEENSSAGHRGEAEEELIPIIQASNEAYAAARTRELVEALEETADALVAFRQTEYFLQSDQAVLDKARALLATNQPTKEA